MEAGLAHDRPQVSVLVATRNCAAVVRNCIDSVLAQQGVKVELLIADGASTDGTAGICREFEHRLAWFRSQADRGVYDAWNSLLAHARGAWICFLGADDYFPASDTLARMTVAAEDRPTGCRLVYGEVHYFNTTGKCVYREGAPWNSCAGEMTFRNAIPHIGTLHERSIFDDGARFDPEYRIAGDYDLVRLESLRNGAHFASGIVAAHAGWGGLSTRADLELQSLREVGRIIRRQDGRHPPAIWYWRCGKVMLRHFIQRSFGASGLATYERAKKLARISRTVSPLAGLVAGCAGMIPWACAHG